MKWNVEFTKSASKQVQALDNQVQIRIRNAIRDKLGINPEKHLVALTGNLRGFYKFRVGTYRLICHMEGSRLVVTVIKIAHRKEVYH